MEEGLIKLKFLFIYLFLCIVHNNSKYAAIKPLNFSNNLPKFIKTMPNSFQKRISLSIWKYESICRNRVYYNVKTDL